MKPVLLSVLILAFVVCCYGVKDVVIENTREQGCVEGVCAPHCAYEGVKLFPSDNLNQPGKCRFLKCKSDFSIVITPCETDNTKQYEWVGKDKNKLYPDCCGTKTRKRN